MKTVDADITLEGLQMIWERNQIAERWNYFNYFTEIEEHFQRRAAPACFCFRPLDWALDRKLEERRRAARSRAARHRHGLRKVASEESEVREGQLARLLRAGCHTGSAGDGKGRRASRSTRKRRSNWKSSETYLTRMLGSARARRFQGDRRIARKARRRGRTSTTPTSSAWSSTLPCLKKDVRHRAGKPDRRRHAPGTPRARRDAPALSQQDDRRSALDAGAPVPRARAARKSRLTATEPFLPSLARPYNKKSR